METRITVVNKVLRRKGEGEPDGTMVGDSADVARAAECAEALFAAVFLVIDEQEVGVEDLCAADLMHAGGVGQPGVGHDELVQAAPEVLVLVGAAGLDDVLSGAERPVDTDLDQRVADTGSGPVRTAEDDAVARENMKSAKAFSEESAHSLKAVPVAGIGEWAMSKKKTGITDDDEE